MDYMISSHGGRYNDTAAIVVPAGVTVKFFVNDGEELVNNPFENSNAWGIYNHLRAGMELPDNIAYINQRVVQTFTAGQQVYNYSCWNMQDINLAQYSGIWIVGGAQVTNLPQEMSLSNIFEQVEPHVPTTIYWVACRSVAHH